MRGRRRVDGQRFASIAVDPRALSEAGIADQRARLQAAIVGTGRLVVRKNWEAVNLIRTGWVR